MGEVEIELIYARPRQENISTSLISVLGFNRAMQNSRGTTQVQQLSRPEEEVDASRFRSSAYRLSDVSSQWSGGHGRIDLHISPSVE